MKLLIITYLILSCSGLLAQEAVVTTGGNASGSEGIASYSLGQVFYTSQLGTTGSVSQGVQQLYEITSTVGVDLATVSLKLMVFPNPTHSNLTLKIGDFNNAKYTYLLINTEGRVIDNQKIAAEQTIIDMQMLPPGTYHLQVQDQDTLIKKFRIIKY